MKNLSYQSLPAILFFSGFLLLTLIRCSSKDKPIPVQEVKATPPAALMAEENGEWLKAAQLYEQLFHQDSSNAEANYHAGTCYLKANYPREALKILNSIDPQHRKKKGDINEAEARIAKGHYMTRQYQKAITVAENYPYSKMYRGLAREHLKSLIRLDQMEALAQQLEAYELSGIYQSSDKKTDADFMFRAICNELYLVNKPIALKQYAQQFKLWLTENSEDDWRNKACAAFYLQNYAEAITLLEKAILEEKSPRYLIELNMLLGVCYAKQGATAKAQDQIQQILSMEDPPPRHDAFGAKSYHSARIEVAMGQNEKALLSLNKALELNAEFWSNKFKEDGFLRPLFGDMAFEELVRVKG